MLLIARAAVAVRVCSCVLKKIFNFRGFLHPMRLPLLVLSLDLILTVLVF